jgi:putative ABC transport system ATP-binding protein
MVRVRNLVKVFFRGTVNENVAIRSVNLMIPEEQFITIVGSNGAGKSTLLNLISGRILPDSGTIEIANRDVTNMLDYERARFVGRVFQNPLEGTAASLTIEENLAIACLKLRRKGLRLAVTRQRRSEFRERLRELGLGLENRLHDRVGLLSGGQRQALAIFMATLTHPQLLLLDEHTASLDPKTAQKILALTDDMVEKNNLTTLMVTHNMQQALEHGERTIMMHEGEIVLDIAGEKRKELTVAHLLDMFTRVRKERLVEDKLLL